MAASKKWHTPGFSTGPSTVFNIHQHNAGQRASKIYLFADDAKLYSQIEDKSDVTRIPEDLQSLETWSSQSLLSFNINKCVHVTIGTDKLDMERNYKINDKNIKKSNSKKTWVSGLTTI